MSFKLKALGLGFIVAVAMGAFVAMSASAFTPANSHFVADPPTHLTKITGTDSFGTNHALSLKKPGDAAGISCTHTTYHGELTGAAATTTQAVRVRPAYSNCATENETWGSVTPTVPAECGTNVFEFTSGTPGTVHLNCDLTFTHPNCTIKIPKQGQWSGVTYKTETEGGKHALTVDVNISNITAHYENKICIFLGTTHTTTLKGSITFFAEDKDNKRINITHT